MAQKYRKKGPTVEQSDAKDDVYGTKQECYKGPEQNKDELEQHETKFTSTQNVTSSNCHQFDANIFKNIYFLLCPIFHDVPTTGNTHKVSTFQVFQQDSEALVLEFCLDSQRLRSGLTDGSTNGTQVLGGMWAESE